MSLPRQILPGATTMVTRRVTQRQFLLLPSAIINQIVLYCLALAAQETGVIVHAVCVLSNHLHIAVTDPHGNLPKFSYILFKYIAKCVNVHRGRSENLFAGGVQPSYVRLCDDNAKLDKMVYIVTNPVEAGLVSSHSKWPGVNRWLPGSSKVKRPPIFFQEIGAMPESLELKLEPIPLDESASPLETKARVGEAIAERERKIRETFKAEKRTFLGVARVRAQKPTDSPTTHEPRRNLSPRIAIRDKWRRVEILQRLKSFWHDYKQALAKWRDGERDVLFPAGVYKMRVEFDVRCAET